MPSFDELRQSASSGLERAKVVVGLKTEEEPDTLDELSDMCPKLTFQQRIMGFGICFSLGYLITFMSFSFFIDLIEGNPLPFVTIYTIGNVLSLLSSMFLCGPKRQFKNMFDEKRRITTIVYLSCLTTTIIIIFIPFGRYDTVKLIVLVVLLLIQFCASIWYTLSYIPYGRRAFTRFANGLFGMDGESQSS